jgi:hypothetical protein
MQLNASLRKPPYRIRGKELMKSLPDKLPAPRIFLNHLPDVITGMRDIAASAPADLYLAEQFTGLFQYHHLKGRIVTGGIDGTEKARSATTDDHQSFVLGLHDPLLKIVNIPYCGCTSTGESCAVKR